MKSLARESNRLHTESRSYEHTSTALRAQVRRECVSMARHALHEGMPVSPEVIAELIRQIDQLEDCEDGSRYRSLAVLHSRLATAVAPATPLAISILDDAIRRKHALHWLGPVPLIRVLTCVTIGFLLALIGVAMSPDVSSEHIDRGFLAAEGRILLVNALFLLCCAGVGASFAALFQAHHYIATSTYNSKYNASYAARLVRGLIAGLILVYMLPPGVFDNSALVAFGKPAISMLGGFSATVVHRLLQRIADAMNTLVRGDQSAELEAAERAYRTRAREQQRVWRQALATEISVWQQSLNDAVSVDDARGRLSELVRRLAVSDVAEIDHIDFDVGEGNAGPSSSVQRSNTTPDK